MKVFIPVVGQVINIGDTLHRKILLSWLRGNAVELHLYVGKAPESFVEALDLDESDKVYTSLGEWLYAIIFQDFLKRKFFVFNPGEITFSSVRLIKEISLLPFYLYIKATGGKILRIGVAAQSDIKIEKKWLWKSLISLSNKIYWRTIRSAQLFNKGEVIPDLAFYKIDEHVDFATKNVLVISLRGDRKFPTQKWFDAIKEFQTDNDLEPVVVSQVKIDNERTVKIAEKLNARFYIWDNERSHNDQEKIVNEVYRRSKIAISDRLHVLIAAFTKGVIPTVVSVEPSDKVQDHFDVLPLHNISVLESEVSKKGIVQFLQNALDAGFDEMKMREVFNRLNKVREVLVESLNQKNDRKTR